jgi:hypothetical protein
VEVAFSTLSFDTLFGLLGVIFFLRKIDDEAVGSFFGV